MPVKRISNTRLFLFSLLILSILTIPIAVFFMPSSDPNNIYAGNVKLITVPLYNDLTILNKERTKVATGIAIDTEFKKIVNTHVTNLESAVESLHDMNNVPSQFKDAHYQLTNKYAMLALAYRDMSDAYFFNDKEAVKRYDKRIDELNKELSSATDVWDYIRDKK